MFVKWNEIDAYHLKTWFFLCMKCVAVVCACNGNHRHGSNLWKYLHILWIYQHLHMCRLRNFQYYFHNAKKLGKWNGTWLVLVPSAVWKVLEILSCCKSFKLAASDTICKTFWNFIMYVDLFWNLLLLKLKEKLD